jgi:hypothetical protein
MKKLLFVVYQDSAKNIQPANFANWPQLEIPWMKQPRGGPLVVTDGRERWGLWF